MRIRKVGIYTGKFYAGLLCVLLAGVLLGSLFYGSMSADTVRSLNSVQAGFLSVRQNLDFSKILLKTLSSSTAFLFVIFASGFCAVGQPAAAAALVLRGLGLGVVLSQMYSAYGLHGMFYSALLIAPNGLICSFALALGAREAICLSNRYAVYTLSDRQENGLRETVRLYCTKFLVLEAVLAVSAGADCLIARLTKGLVPV